MTIPLKELKNKGDTDMITAEEFKNLTEDEQLDNIETMTSEERMQLVKGLFPNFKLKTTKMGYDNEGRNKYKVTISNGEMPFSTVFYDSLYNTQKGEKSDDFNILYCIISDAQAVEYCDTVEDFMAEFGYSEEDKPNKIFKACQRSYNNLTNTFGHNGYEILSTLTYNF